jgi:hypothetical protein
MPGHQRPSSSAASKYSSHGALNRPHATATAFLASAETFSDRAATKLATDQTVDGESGRTEC